MQSIHEYWLKIKVYLNAGLVEWGMAILVVLVALACFGLGRLSTLSEGRGGIQIVEAATAAAAMAPGGLYVASKTGKTYHYPWCSGAQSIPEASKVWFKDEAAAQNSGYRAAKNCKGLSK